MRGTTARHDVADAQERMGLMGLVQDWRVAEPLLVQEAHSSLPFPSSSPASLPPSLARSPPCPQTLCLTLPHHIHLQSPDSTPRSPFSSDLTNLILPGFHTYLLDNLSSSFTFGLTAIVLLDYSAAKPTDSLSSDVNTGR